MKTKILIKFIFVSFLFICVSTSSAKEDTRWDVYDENTEITIKGEIVEVSYPSRGPVILKVKTVNKQYNVVTAPRWYLTRNNLDFKLGETIEIIGSKFISREGELYIITRKCRCKTHSNPYIFRDEYMRPMWRGGMHRR